ncbi:MAG: hypothetical protein WC376_00790 [Candidatus Nanoarchaeia archaeon]|jgi:hypothetical protein
MKKTYLMLLFLIIFISGCSQQQTGRMAYTEDLNIYGELIDYSQNGNFTFFKIQPGFVDYELNDSLLDINLIYMKTFSKLDELIICLGLYTEDYGSSGFVGMLRNDYISLDSYLKEKGVSADKLDSCKSSVFEEAKQELGCINAYLSETYMDNIKKGYGDFWNFGVSCYMNINITKGNSYAFYFIREENSEPWSLLSFSQNFSKYAKEGAFGHERDLMIDNRNLLISDGGSGSASRIMPQIIYRGASSINSTLVNNQDVNISYRIKNLRLINLIGNCNVNFDELNHSIQAKSSETLNFDLNCSENVELSGFYYLCSGGSRKNCAERPDFPNSFVCDECPNNETFSVVYVNNDVQLVGTLEYADELGNLHIIFDKEFSQNIEIK